MHTTQVGLQAKHTKAKTRIETTTRSSTTLLLPMPHEQKKEKKKKNNKKKGERLAAQDHGNATAMHAAALVVLPQLAEKVSKETYLIFR